MPKKPKPKASTTPPVPQKALSAELLAKAYRLVKRSGIPETPAMSLDDIVAFSQTPEGRAQTIAHIQRHGGPLHGADPKYPDLIVEVSPDGTSRLGRFVNRKFVEWAPPSAFARHEPHRPSCKPENQAHYGTHVYR